MPSLPLLSPGQDPFTVRFPSQCDTVSPSTPRCQVKLAVVCVCSGRRPRAVCGRRMVIPLHGVAGSTRRDPDTTAKSYNYCVATANRHGHAVVSNDIAFSRSAVTHRRSSAVMTATMNPRFVRPAPSALGPAHTPRIAGREPGVAHTSDTKTPCRAQNTISEPHTTASRNRPPLRRTHCDGAGGPSQGATSQGGHRASYPRM